MIATLGSRAGLAALVCIAGLSAPLPARADSTVRCESNSHQTNYCDADVRGGVHLVRQLSNAGCWENDTWGYDRRGIWVSNGCRADFATADGRWEDDRHDSGNKDAAIAGAVVLGLIGAAVLADKHNDRKDRDDRYDDDRYGGFSITCESDNGRQRRCPANIGRRRVEIERVLSRGECRYGQSWGVDRDAIWVDRGCRARFSVQ